MPCSICGEIGHNRRTCPQSRDNDIPAEVLQQQGLINQLEQDQARDIELLAQLEQEQERDRELIAQIELAVEKAEEIVRENEQEQQQDKTLDDDVLLLFVIELELRKSIINNNTHLITDETLKFYNSCIGVMKKELKIINLESKSFEIFIVEGNNNINDLDNQPNKIYHLGTLNSRSMLPMISFTGYRYIIVDKESLKNKYSKIWVESKISFKNTHKNISEINILENMTDNILINYMDDKLTTDKLNDINKSLFSSLKMNFLIKEMIRLGGLDNPNFEPILDLHQDITMPKYDLIDLEAAGVPNEFTNIT